MKSFDPDHRLTKEEETRLLSAAIQSPTSFNIQPWRFIIARDLALRRKIRTEYGNDQAQMTDASLLIIMTADVKAWAKEPQTYWQNAPKEVAAPLVNWMDPFHEGREWLQRDEAQRSTGLAMGYDSCSMIGFDSEKVAELIKLLDGYVMGPMVAVGKKAKDS